MRVDTKRVPIRELRFQTIDDALAEIKRLAEAERAGRVERMGNWTTGQVFGHLAYWIDGSFDGGIKPPPWFIRMIGPMLKRGMLRGPMKQGFRLPGAPEGTHGTEVLSLDEGLSRVTRAFERLKAGAPQRRNPVFGWMTHAEWIALNLRHAELHLGFLTIR